MNINIFLEQFETYKKERKKKLEVVEEIKVDQNKVINAIRRMIRRAKIKDKAKTIKDKYDGAVKKYQDFHKKSNL